MSIEVALQVVSSFSVALVAFGAYRYIRHARRADRDTIYDIRHLEQLMRDVQRRARSIDKRLRIESSSGVTWDDLSGRRTTADESEDLRRGDPFSEVLAEIAHSINTPLSQIELAITRVLPLVGQTQKDDLETSLSAALRSVEYSRSVLAAYQALGILTESPQGWDLDDLELGIREAHAIYNRLHRTGTHLDIAVPATPLSYSNYLIMAMVLPLIQNAVEHGARNTLVRCRVHEDDEFRFTIENRPARPVDIQRMYKPGYTSKVRVQGGLGLSSTRRLVARHQGRLDLFLDSDVLSARITLPRAMVKR